MKKTFFILIIFFGFIFSAKATLAASNHFIRDGATGTSCADWGTACDSLPANLVRGDTYYIADGTYGSYSFDDAVSGTSVITIKKATASDHGTETGWNSTYGDGQSVWTGQIGFTSSYWVFDGATGGGAVNNWNQNFGFKITETGDSNAIIVIAFSGTANNITIRHVDMQGKGSVSSQGGSYSNDGLAVYGASNVTLSYYWMHGLGRAPFFLAAPNFIAEHGWVESYNGSSAVHSEVASIWAFDGNVGDTTFRYNLFTAIISTGGLMWDNSSNTNAHMYVYGNIFYKPAGASWSEANGLIGGWTGGNGEECRNVLVYNNSFINVDQESLSTLPNITSGNVAYNNLWYNSQAPSFSKFLTHDYNYFINSGGTQSEAQGISGSSDPFVGFVNKNFALKAATSAGLSLSSPYNIDPLGVTRGSDGTWDRGAFEYGGTTPPNAAPAAPTGVKVM